MARYLDTHPFIKRIWERIVMIFVSWTAVVICIFGTFLALGGFLLLTALGSDEAADETTDSGYTTVYGNGVNQLLSIKVSGTITGTDDGASGFFSDASSTAGYSVKEKLQAAANDPTIQGIVLEINSPGGTIYGARAIADGVTFYQEKTGNPVYAYVEGQAASGGYWAASPADSIIADYGSDVGSIGVIMGPFQYYDKVLAEDGGLLSGGVVTQNGIQSMYISAGASKDVGNPYRKLTDAELRALQTSVNNEYDMFVAYVSKHRNIPADTIRNTIGALSYDNKTALTYKLIDHTGSRDAAYNALAKAADVEDDFSIVREEYQPGFFESILMATGMKPQKKVQSPAERNAELCSLTRSSLAYHGDVARLCRP
jgi:protease IV